jgi:hypothetical protein
MGFRTCQVFFLHVYKYLNIRQKPHKAVKGLGFNRRCEETIGSLSNLDVHFLDVYFIVILFYLYSLIIEAVLEQVKAAGLDHRDVTCKEARIMGRR